jgi:acyl-CoA synthetase (NDP forming)
VPEPVDLAVIATPAIVVPEVVSDCAEVGVKWAVMNGAKIRRVGTVFAPQGPPGKTS